MTSRRPIKCALGGAAAVLVGAMALGGCSSSRGSEPPVKIPVSNVPVNIYSVDPTQPLLGTAFEVFLPPSKNVDWLYRLVALARTNIDISTNRLTDPNLIKLLTWQAQGGVPVRVLLDHSAANQVAYYQLRGGGVQVAYAQSSLLQTTITLDRRESIITGATFLTNSGPTSRSFGVIDHDPRDVHAVLATFAVDWSSSRSWSLGRRGPHLSWSPGGLTPSLKLISEARTSVVAETVKLDSPQIVSALVAVAQRGVSASVVVSPGGASSAVLNTLSRGGVHVAILPTAVYRISGNAIVVNSQTASFGSQSLSQAGLVSSRALNVVFDSTSVGVVPAVSTAVNNDLARAVPYVATGS